SGVQFGGVAVGRLIVGVRVVAEAIDFEPDDGRRARLAHVIHNAAEAAAGGTIAFVNEGDSITIDAHKLVLELNVPEAELAKRREGWKPPAPRYTRGVQAKFAFNASSASSGAVLDKF
ncbi:MAG TPA: dihydroxy-acid dehydratase, partial [Variovorax sp.]|nr:dihydroxy-acid dehydratase [Variovorax sp.]